MSENVSAIFDSALGIIENTATNPTFIAVIIGSLITAFASFILFKLQKRHDIRSVSPLPYFSIRDEGDRIELRLENNGLGPLIINSAYYYLESKADPYKDEDEDGSFFAEVIKKNFIDIENNVGEIDFENFTGRLNGRSIPATESIQVLAYKRESKTDFVFDRIRDGMKKSYILLTYTDIYKSCVWQKSENFKWLKKRDEINQSK